MGKKVGKIIGATIGIAAFGAVAGCGIAYGTNTNFKKNVDTTFKNVFHIESKKEDKSDSSNALVDGTEAFNELQEKLKETQNQLNEITQAKEDLEIKLNNTNKTITILQSQKSETEEKLKTALSEKATLQNQLDEKISAIEVLTASKTNLETELATTKTNLEQANSDKENLQTRLDTVNAKLETTTTEKESLLTEKATLEDQLEEKVSAIQILTESKTNLETELATTKTNLEQANSDKTTLQTNLDTANSNIQILQTEKTNLQNQINEAKETIKTLTSEKQQLQAELDEKNELLAGFDTKTVKFNIDGVETIQNVVYGCQPKNINVPTKEGYTFAYWLKSNSEKVYDLSLLTITSDINLTAVYKQKYTAEEINFNDDIIVYLNGSFIWNYNNCTFYSDDNNNYKLNYITNKWEKITWNVALKKSNLYFSGNECFYLGNKVQINTQNYEITVLETYTGQGGSNWDYYKNCWTYNGDIYYSNSSSHYKLNKETKAWEKITWSGLSSFYGSHIWNCGENYYYSNSSNQYKLNNETKTWEKITWSGIAGFYGSSVKKIGNDILVISNKKYKLNQQTNSWESEEWSGFIPNNGFVADSLWSDGNLLYYTYPSDKQTYCYNQETNIWTIDNFYSTYNIETSKMFVMNNELYYSDTSIGFLKYDKYTNKFKNHYFTNGKGFFLTSSVFKINENYFSSNYYFNKLTNQFISFSFSGISITPGDLWFDGENTYYANGSRCYKINSETYQLEQVTWSGLTSFEGKNVWSDGINIYYSDFSKQYKLNKSTKTWEAVTWNFSSFIGANILNYKNEVYLFQNGSYYKLNKTSNSWESISIDNLTGIVGSYIFNFNDILFYSKNNKIYQLFL